jgi:hypothetical protein
LLERAGKRLLLVWFVLLLALIGLVALLEATGFFEH